MVTLDFSSRDTIINKGVGAATTEIEFTATAAKTTLFTTSFTGTIEEVSVAATATSAASGMTNPARLSAKVYTNIGGTETAKTFPIIVWHNGQTSTSKYGNLIIPINKKFTTATTVTISVEFVETNTNTLTNFGGVANLGYTTA